MEELKKLLEKYVTEELLQMILSNPKKQDLGKKIQIRPIKKKGSILFQASIYQDTKVYHKNSSREEMTGQIFEWMENYKQLELHHCQGDATVLISKKGKVTIKEKKQQGCVKKPELSHNRKKKYILNPEEPVEFLVDLGVQTREGKIVNTQYDKFRQINRFLEFIQDILPQLPKDREIKILDFGCGKSYLTFAMYYYLKILKEYQVKIIGLDLKEDVISHCNSLAQKYQYENLHFLVGNIENFTQENQVDMVVTLHACDTATDYALDKAVSWGAKVILSVPCCQHEVNHQIKNQVLAPVFKYGLIKERMSALFTDAIRALILESQGYDVQILEFIDMEHTPKNILIRAVKGTSCKKPQEYQEILEFLNIHPTLAKLQKKERE